MSANCRWLKHTSGEDKNSPEEPAAYTLQTVFRVSPRGPRQSEFHSRRAHKKSRSGCLTCKKRRVKCDEGKPVCQRCKTRGIGCGYPSGSEVARRRDDVSSPSPSVLLSSMCLESITDSIKETLSYGVECSPYVLSSNASQDPLSTVAFNHFVRFSTDTIPTPCIREVMKTDVVRVAFANPHLMYTLLGVGMLHFNRYAPNKERSVAESYFWQHAINLYQEALSSKIHEGNIDALLSTCMLMGVMTICPEKFDVTDSWVLTNKPEALNWLALQSGLSCILQLASSLLPKSIWGEAFKEVDKEGDKIFKQEEKTGREGLDSDLADLCGITEESTPDSSVYYPPLRYLSKLVGLEPNGPNAAHVASFMGRLECDFMALLRKRDPPALIILAHWMGLMCCLSEWQPWVEGRIRKECIAICMFLEYSTDPRILLLLRFPAEACGYKLGIFT
ncbi:hypothetical protein N7456_005189 [Penicillium angulare]|uniref:Zn(2)-C6 fungal-type domain-containing protein n=1 Tax=Penicillium angulare TaxID=116970 RepID=A0A9W9FY38_9EURO|nr:hypothetical protein N7456_005189 [Penicillium angulare]